MSPERQSSKSYIADIERAAADRGAIDWIIFVGSILFAVWHIYTNLVLIEPGIWQNAIHFAGFAFIAAVTTTFVSGYQTKRMYYVNIVFGVLIAVSALWIAAAENGVYERTLAKTGLSWQFGVLDWIAGFIVIIGAIELTRRLTGLIIPFLVLLALSYILFLLSLIHI